MHPQDIPGFLGVWFRWFPFSNRSFSGFSCWFSRGVSTQTHESTIRPYVYDHHLHVHDHDARTWDWDPTWRHGKISVKKLQAIFTDSIMTLRWFNPPPRIPATTRITISLIRKIPNNKHCYCKGGGPHPRGKAPDRILLHRLGLFRLLGDLEIFWKNLRAVDPPRCLRV